MRSVFLSFCSADADAARAVRDQLESRGLSSWLYCEDNHGSPDWIRGMLGALDECRCVVSLMSSSYEPGSYVDRELDEAWRRGLPVLPVRLEDVEPPPAWRRWESAGRVDVFPPAGEAEYRRLANHVRILVRAGRRRTWTVAALAAAAFAAGLGADLLQVAPPLVPAAGSVTGVLAAAVVLARSSAQASARRAWRRVLRPALVVSMAVAYTVLLGHTTVFPPNEHVPDPPRLQAGFGLARWSLTEDGWRHHIANPGMSMQEVAHGHASWDDLSVVWQEWSIRAAAVLLVLLFLGAATLAGWTVADFVLSSSRSTREP